MDYHHTTSYKKIGEYRLGSVIGEGEFSKVKIATHLGTGEQYALKIVSKEQVVRKKMLEHLKKEISILKRLNHPNVITLHQIIESKTKIYIVMELVSGGELFYKLVSVGRFDEETAKKYFRQLLAGLSYCHKQGICHRDLKPENLLLTTDGILKISDFGFGTITLEKNGREKMLHTTCGTLNYAAPEILDKKGYDGKKADIWSSGCILYVMLTGMMPFSNNNLNVLYDQIRKGVYRPFPDGMVSSQCEKLIDKMICVDPQRRINLQGILASAWLNPDGANDLESHSEDLSSRDVSEDEQNDDNRREEFDKFEEVVESKHAKPLEKKNSGGMRTANAFDIISTTGALDISSLLFQNNNKNNKLGSKNLVHVQTSFASDQKPEFLMEKITEVLQTQISSREVGVKDNKTSYKILATGSTAQGGVINMHVQILFIAPGLHLVDFRKGKGDILEYFKFYNEVRDKLKTHGLGVTTKKLTKKRPITSGNNSASTTPGNVTPASRGSPEMERETGAPAIVVSKVEAEREPRYRAPRKSESVSNLPVYDSLTVNPNAASDLHIVSPTKKKIRKPTRRESVPIIHFGGVESSTTDTKLQTNSEPPNSSRI